MFLHVGIVIDTSGSIEAMPPPSVTKIQGPLRAPGAQVTAVRSPGGVAPPTQLKSSSPPPRAIGPVSPIVLLVPTRMIAPKSTSNIAIERQSVGARPGVPIGRKLSWP